MKKQYYIILGIVAIFIVTNPSASAFKEYIGSSSYSGLQRTGQYFVCSVYQHEGVSYFGVAGNFFRVTREKESQIYYEPRKSDADKLPETAKTKSVDTTWKPPAKDTPVN